MATQPTPAPGLVAGCDEVGRGSWAGPVVAAAVILDPARPIAGLADSKALTPRRRDALDLLIRANCLAFALGRAEVAEIDTLNILQATLLAMQRAVAALPLRPGLVLVDGNRAPRLEQPCRTIVGGDASEPAISAASIVAKVWRDRYMRDLAQREPQFGFERHAGYGTMQHLRALQQFGPGSEHRRSFAPIRRVLEASNVQNPP